MALILTYRYWIIFPLAVIEGPILALLCGFLVRLGTFEIVPLFIIFYLADLIGDIVWYWVGRRWGHSFIQRFGRFVSITEDHVATVKKIFHRYHTPILLVSKVTMGLGFPGAVLFTAGLARIPFFYYLMLNAIGQIVWTALLLAIGYYLGNLYTSVNGVFGLVSSLALLVIAAAAIFGFARYVRSTITEKVQ